MSKLRKTILIIGILIVAVAASLGTALALYATGSIKTDPIELVYVLRDREKVYDGTPLKLDDQLNDIMLKEGKLAAGHYAKVEFLGSQTDVGESESDATVKIYDENGFNVTGDYSIKVQSAYLTVYKKTISVELPAQKVVYNGSKVLFNEYKISDDSEGGLCSGHRIYGSTDAELLNVGDTLPEDLEPLIFDVVGKDVTANYEIVDFKYDGIEVVKRPITVRPVSYEKVYDGKAVVAKEIEFVDGSSLVDGQICEFVINEGYGDHITNVDEIETQVTSLFIYDYKDGEKVDVTENYEFNLQEYTGYLKVTPRPLTVVAKSGTFVYNGDEQSMQNDTAPLSVEGLAEGEELVSVSYLGSRRDVGVSENVIAEVTLKGLVENYEISRVAGAIEITHFETTVRTFSSDKYYDGDPLTDGHIEYTLANENHNVVAGELPSLTDVGEITNSYDITFVDEYGDCTHNYAITYDYGTLTVKRLPVKVTLVSDADDREKVNYDSTTHTPTLENESYFTVAPLLPDGETVEKFTLDFTDFEVVAENRAMCVAGEYYYTVKFKDKEVAQRQRYSNYELYVPESGVLEVTPLPISVTLKEFTEAAAFTYTGKALKVDVNKAIDVISLQRGVTLTEGIELDNLIKKKDFSVVADEIIDAGDDYLYTVKISDSATAKNFDVDVSGVQISVNPMPVTVTLKDAARTYNGEAQTVAASETVVSIEKTPPVAEGDYADDTGLTAGDLSVVFTASTPDKVKDADSYVFEVEVSKKKLQKNYKLTFKSADDNSREYALLKIARFVLEVTTDTPDLTYNGLNQSSGEFTYGELANAKHKVSRLTNINRLPVVRDVCDAVGRKLIVENRFDVAVYDGTENVTENYKLDYTYGELSVKPFPITVSTGSANKVYDGMPLRNGELISDNELFLDHRLTALEDLTEITDVGSVRNEYLWDILSGGKSVLSNYEVTTDYGELEVTRRAITLETAGDSRAYNGELLFNTEVSIKPSLTGAMRNYKAQLPAGAKPFGITNAGSVKNLFDCVIVTGTGADVTDNFDISYSEDCGMLTVTPVAITFSLDDFADNEDVDMEYDGKQKKFEINQAIKHITLDGTEYEVIDERTGSGIEFAKSDFEIVYSSAIIDAGNYSYTVKFTDEAFANNFTVVNPEKQMTCTVRVKKKAISINVIPLTGDDALLFNNKVHELKVTDVVVSIWDKKKDPVKSELISVKELTLECSDVLFNAGDYTYKVKIEDDVFARNFLYTEPEGDITVKQFNVNVTLQDLTATYSGEEFVFPAGTAGVLSAKLNDEENIRDVLSGADFAFATKDGSLIIDADEYDYVAVLTDETKARNYHLTMDDATVTIEQLEVNVSAKPVVLTFNGKELEIDGEAALNIGNPLLTAADFDFTTWQGSFKTPLLKSGDYTFRAELKSGNFSIIDYEDGIVDGTVKVNKCAVTVTLNALSKEYDGEEFDLSPKKSVVIIDGKEFTLTQSPIASVESDVFTKDDFVLIYDEITPLDDHSNFGTYNLTAKLAESYDEFNGDVEITVENGEVTISKKKVTLTTQTKSFEYNGERQSATDAELVGAVAGHYAKAVDYNREIVYVINVTATPVDNDSEYRIFRKVVNYDDSETEIDVTENYDIETVYGTLTVTPLAVTITTEGASRPYNGRALSNAEITADGLIAGHTLVTPEEADLPSVTEVEKIKNEYDISITATVDGSATDVTGNYEITFVYGDLEVTAIEITLNLKDNIKTPYKGLNGNISLNGNDVIDSVDGDSSLSLADFAVTFDGEAVNAGDYTFTVSLKSEENAKHYSIISGDSGVCTVTKADFTVTLKAYTGATAKEYTGKVQESKASDITITANAANNPDGLTAADLEFKYFGGMLNVGEYAYNVEIKDKELAGNYNLSAEDAKYDIVPAQITVTLQNYEKTYNGTAYTVDVLLAITNITDKNGDKSELLEKSDFKAVYEQEMRLANGIIKPLPDDEAYTGEIKLIDDKAYKVITGDNYTYGVELIDRNLRGNFDITVVGGEFKINKRLLTFTAVNVYMSREDYEMGGYADELEFEVTDYVSISSNTTLAGDDQLRITKAIAEKEYTDSTVLYLYAFDEYTLDNEDCYEFTNVNGKVPVSLQLIFTD